MSTSLSPQVGARVLRLDEAMPSEAAYRADIDGLRAVAVLSVLAYHANPALLPGGFAGVDVFFVISGYLISTIIFRKLERGRFSLIEFYARRIRRLFPALIVVFSLVWLAAWFLLLSDELTRLGKHMAAGAAFSLNLFLFGTASPYAAAHSQPLLHLWSLGVEEQFYLVWPVLLWVIWNFLKKWVLPIIAAITVLSFVANLFQMPWNPIGAFYLPWHRLWELSIGSGLAYVSIVRAGEGGGITMVVARVLSLRRSAR